jgi:hypothetical protein
MNYQRVGFETDMPRIEAADFGGPNPGGTNRRPQSIFRSEAPGVDVKDELDEASHVGLLVIVKG